MRKTIAKEYNKKTHNLKTFSIHETKRSSADVLKTLILDYKHFENMLLILMSQCYENKRYDILNLLQNKVVMKAISQKLKGKDKTKENIQQVYSYFERHELFQSMIDFSKNKLNGHNCSMIVERLKKDWNNSKERRKDYFKNPSQFSGEPQFPKPKKLQKISNYSIPLESSKWSIFNGYLGINLTKKQIKRKIGMDCDYLEDKIIKSITISLTHGHIYYNFNYILKKSIKLKKLSCLKDKVVKKQKEAGLDVGIINLASIFINDNTTQSLIIDGQRFKKYNSSFNRKIASLNEQIAKEVIEKKIIKNKNGEKIEVPLSYSEYGLKLRHLKDNITEERNRYFDDQFNKISKKILSYLKYHNVTDLVVSKNLSNTKTTGEIKQKKKSKQHFYQIPIGKLINLIIEKSPSFDIEVKDINEAYTSKTSSISGDVNEIVEIRKNNPTYVFKPTDLKGSRGLKNKSNKTKDRGLFFDNIINKVINSDLNGAANHVKVGFPNVDLSYLKTTLFKVCNPKKIKCEAEFEIFLKSQIGVDVKNYA